MKVIIIGSSVAGSTMALALSKFCEVSVYERKKREQISEKACGNICTASLEKYASQLGLDINFILSRYRHIRVFTKNNSAHFPTQEFEVSRKKLLSEVVKNAERNGAKFNFSTSFHHIEGRNGHHEVFLSRKGKIFSDKADIIIGADGATSEFAKSAGLFKNRDFFLFLQTKVRTIRNKDFLPDKKSYCVFVGKNYGYYAYIFPSKDGKEFKIGLGDRYESDVSEKFGLFLDFLGAKKSKVEGALIPMPDIAKNKSGIYLIGDASCSVKYSGGGIVPIFEQVLALRDKIISNKSSRMWRFKKKMILNMRITRFIEKMDDKDLDELLEILKGKNFEKAFSFRDDLGNADILRMLSPKSLWFFTKVMLKR